MALAEKISCLNDGTKCTTLKLNNDLFSRGVDSKDIFDEVKINRWLNDALKNSIEAFWWAWTGKIYLLKGWYKMYDVRNATLYIQSGIYEGNKSITILVNSITICQFNEMI